MWLEKGYCFKAVTKRCRKILTLGTLSCRASVSTQNCLVSTLEDYFFWRVQRQDTVHCRMRLGQVEKIIMKGDLVVSATGGTDEG